MSLDGRFHRYGERRRELRVLNDACVDLGCWDPAVIIHNGRDMLRCLTAVRSGCPEPIGRAVASSAERDRRRREWVRG